MRIRSKLKRITGAACAIAIVLGLLSALQVSTAPAAEALDGSQFNPGFIISDENFFNSAAMTGGEVQSFLNSKVSSCPASAGQPCLKNYSQATQSQPATAYCGAYTGQASESAAEIIARVGVACGISQQVLLVVLQKETGLITATSPSALTYRKAMGYGCPDTADCDAAYYGFFNQVYNAASQYQRYTKTSSKWSYQPGRSNNILWNPNAACGSSSVYIQNQATANLYIYTPYQPNQAALSNMYGTGDGCSSYGNRNFWAYFSDWFGSPTEGKLVSPSFEGGSIRGWGASNGFLNQQVAYGPSQAQSGEYFLATNTSVVGRAMTQDVTRNTGIGQQVTAKIWVRSASGAPFNGVLALWGMGGTRLEGANTAFTATATWQEITVVLPIRASAHPQIRLDVYLNSLNNSLWVDNASMSFGEAPPVQNLLEYGSFEGSFGAWAPGNGFMNQQIYNDPSLAKDGKWIAATNTAVSERSLAQELPVSGKKNDRFTFSVWVRAADASKPFQGTVALWGFGPSPDAVSLTRFTATGEWQRVSATIDVGAAGISRLKAEVYLTSTDNTLWLDDAILGPNLLTAGSFEDSSFQNWGTGSGTTNQAVYPSHDSNIAAHGSYFAATNTVSGGGSVAQVVPRQTSVGDKYTAEVWVRSGDPSKTYSGTLALWALGGATEVATTQFTVGGSWQKIQLQLPIGGAGHNQLKFEIYLGTTENTLFFDGAQVY